jgi:hypothetical protein
MSDQVISPRVKSLITNSIVPNVKPTGHTRQKTGKPKTAVETTNPPRMKCRESKGFRVFEQEEHPFPETEAFNSAFSLPVSPSVFSGLGVSTKSPGCTWLTLVRWIVSLRLKRLRILCTTGIGQIQAQNARPNKTMSATTTPNEIMACGIIVFDATMTLSAPSGHKRAISDQPIAESVPTPLLSIKPILMTTSSNDAVRVRKVFDFMSVSQASLSGRTTTARSVAPLEIDAFCNETQTLSQAPQPLQSASITKGRP